MSSRTSGLNLTPWPVSAASSSSLGMCTGGRAGRDLAAPLDPPEPLEAAAVPLRAGSGAASSAGGSGVLAARPRGVRRPAGGASDACSSVSAAGSSATATAPDSAAACSSANICCSRFSLAVEAAFDAAAESLVSSVLRVRGDARRRVGRLAIVDAPGDKPVRCGWWWEGQSRTGESPRMSPSADRGMAENGNNRQQPAGVGRRGETLRPGRTESGGGRQPAASRPQAAGSADGPQRPHGTAASALTRPRTLASNSPTRAGVAGSSSALHRR